VESADFLNLQYAFPMSILFRFLTTSFLFATPLVQAALPYSNGDILLGFRAGSDPGSNQNYVVNLGPASQFTAALDPFTVQNLGSVGADLANTFSDPEATPWHQRSDVFWGAAGTDLAEDPANTLYISRPRSTPPTQSAPWDRRTNGAQSITNSIFRAFISGYLNSTANATSLRATIQPASSANSYAFFTQPGVDFSSFAGIEGDFTNGATGSVLDLYRLTPTTQNPAGQGLLFVGSFSVDTAGTLSFLPPEPSAPRFRIQSSTYSTLENSGTLLVRVTRSGPSNSTDSVQIDPQNGTAIGGTDFTAPTPTVTFEPGQTQKEVSIPLCNRTGIQTARSFQLVLSNPSTGTTVGVPASTTVSIQDASSELQFSSSTYSVNEDASSLSVVVTRAGFTARTDTVRLNTTNATAVAGTDYTAQTNLTVTLESGETQKEVVIPILNRSGVQPGRTFSIQLTTPSSDASLGATASTTATINDVSAPQFGTLAFASTSIQAAPVNSSAQPNTIPVTVTRTGGSDGTVTVSLSASTASTLSSPAQYQTLPTQLTFNAGDTSRTFNVQLNAIPARSLPGTIQLQLASPTGGATLGASGFLGNPGRTIRQKGGRSI
jgi:hypothetical protein